MFVLQRSAVLRLSTQQLRRLRQRYVHTEVRVRFAPSPTGHLHLGGLRTALYNYLFARHHNGKFLLRIEDTDRTRLVPGAMESLIDDLLWAGIDIDEGPLGFGGSHGPYVQSERTEIYEDAIQQLLSNGTAYRCFCSERRLELLRKEAARTRQVPRYDNKCRHLTTQEADDLLRKGTPHCVRFKLTDYLQPFDDLIYGPVTHNVSETEGDPVIMKSDRYPTYHFANVVDDHRMRVTHVLRGVEWQISTTKHLQLYRAFGWQPPQFGHLPLLVNADGTKLSKRQGDIGIRSFRSKGFFPESLVNYVISAGGGFTRERHTKPQIFTMPELSQQFDIGKVNAHPSRLNPDLLDDFQRLQLMKLLKDQSSNEKLVAEVQALIRQSYGTESNLDLDPRHVERILHWSVQRLTFVQDLVTPQMSFLWVRPAKFVLSDITSAHLRGLIDSLESLDFSKDQLNAALRDFAAREQIKFAVLMKVLRSALSGLKEGPGVAEMMEILGKATVIERLRQAAAAETDQQRVGPEEGQVSAGGGT